MKRLMIMGMLAVLMFSVSAAMSVWLRESRRETDSAASEKSAEKAAKKQVDTEKNREPSEPKIERSQGLEPSSTSVMRDRELKMERRAAQMDIITRDYESQREIVDGLVKQVSAELKAAPIKQPETEVKPEDVEKKKAQYEAAEKKNIEKMAAMYDAMEPEKAAAVLKQMADSGRMDTAVRILAAMKERAAARILESLGDTSLAAQLLDKLRALRPARPTGDNQEAPPGPGR